LVFWLWGADDRGALGGRMPLICFVSFGAEEALGRREFGVVAFAY
jgi:hypothetical protein